MKLQIREDSELRGHELEGCTALPELITLLFLLGEEEAATSYIPNSLNPTWNFLTYFPIDELSDDLNLNIEVKDHNPIRSHANLGKISLSVSEIARKRHINKEWRKLDGVDTGEIGM